ncbi:MAG: hypothetical protein AAGI34_15045 [Pseudomonadota bacterium]
MLRPLATLAVLALTAGCMQEPQATAKRSADGMLDPATGTLDPKFADGSFSLADLYATKLLGPVSNSDRRQMDVTLDQVLVEPERTAGRPWANAVTEHEGRIDLVSWAVDARAGELCGTIEHDAVLDATLAGVVIVCRANSDPAWTVNEVVWKEAVAKAPAAAPKTPRRAKAKAKPKPSSPRVARATPPARTAPAKPPANTAPSGTGVRPPNFTPPACPGGVGAGSQTLGDCLAAPN